MLIEYFFTAEKQRRGVSAEDLCVNSASLVLCGDPSMQGVHYLLNASKRISAVCFATFPVASLIWCRQLVPEAAIIRSPELLTTGNNTSSPICWLNAKCSFS